MNTGDRIEVVCHCHPGLTGRTGVIVGPSGYGPDGRYPWLVEFDRREGDRPDAALQGNMAEWEMVVTSDAAAAEDATPDGFEPESREDVQ